MMVGKKSTNSCPSPAENINDKWDLDLISWVDEDGIILGPKRSVKLN
jgi:hypothetical protein